MPNLRNFGVAGARVGLKIQRTEVRFPEVPLISGCGVMVAAPDLGSGVLRRGGSSPFIRTNGQVTQLVRVPL